MYSLKEEVEYAEKVLAQCNERGYISVEDYTQLSELCPVVARDLAEYICECCMYVPAGMTIDQMVGSPWKWARLLLWQIRFDVSGYKIPDVLLKYKE